MLSLPAEKVRAATLLGLSPERTKALASATRLTLRAFLLGRWAEHVFVTQNSTTRRTTRSHVGYLVFYLNELPLDVKAQALLTVKAFSEFTRDNDPYGEHDFVNIEHDGEKYFAKLDYYAADMEGGSEDPSDPSKTVRVLTIMRAHEY